jgi:hypothetical protein
MTTKNDIWARVDAYTQKASDNVRTYAIAGLAGVWLFTGLSEGSLTDIQKVPALFIISGGVFAAALAMDVLHYVVGGYAYRRWLLEPAQRAKKDTEDVILPSRVRAWPFTFYYAKLLSCAVAYGFFSVGVFSLY